MPRTFRLSFLPPLFVYFSFGAASLTTVAEAFVVKELLDISPEVQASAFFWAALPWTAKVPIGYAVDRAWRSKWIVLVVGAAACAASIAIMYGLARDATQMQRYLGSSEWFFAASILSSLGFVVQDIVADALTVDAVPTEDVDGSPLAPESVHPLHSAMQAWGRAASIAGMVVSGVLGLLIFYGSGALDAAARQARYVEIFRWAFIIPALSLGGIVISPFLSTAHYPKPRGESGEGDASILVAGFLYVAVAVTAGTLGRSLAFVDELVFAASLITVVYLLRRLTLAVDRSTARFVIMMTAVLFAVRAVPTVGAGLTWWQIDDLGFDEEFQSMSFLAGNAAALVLMPMYLRLIDGAPLLSTYRRLAMLGMVAALPTAGMFWGLHRWTSSLSGGFVDARFIAILGVVAQWPLVMVAELPALARIARIAPRRLKATFFAVVATTVNVAGSLSWLVTKYLNSSWPVERGDYGNVGILLIITTVSTAALPLGAIRLAEYFDRDGELSRGEFTGSRTGPRS